MYIENKQMGQNVANYLIIQEFFGTLNFSVNL